MWNFHVHVKWIMLEVARNEELEISKWIWFFHSRTIHCSENRSLSFQLYVGGGNSCKSKGPTRQVNHFVTWQEGECGLLWSQKSFEISVEEVGEKLKGVIVEKVSGLSAWIRFGDLSLRWCLLEGVEACCRDESLERWSNGWEEGRRRFKLERRANGTGSFLFCFVMVEEGKRFSLLFPKGRDSLGGWSVLAETLGVVPPTKARSVISPVKLWRGPSEEPVAGSFADALRKDLGVVRDAAWLQLEESEGHGKEEYFRRCLVGWFGKSPEPFLELSLLKLYVLKIWSVKGGLKISAFGGTLMLFEFEDLSEAERVLVRGSRRIKENLLNLVRWTPEVFRKIGFCCGGFIAVDEDTACMANLQWARILVKSVGRVVHGKDGPSLCRVKRGRGGFLKFQPGLGSFKLASDGELGSSVGLFPIDEVRELVQGGGEVAVTERREEGDDGAAPRPFGVAVVDPVFVMTERKEESCEGDLIECLGSCLALLVDSQAAISDELRVQDGSLEHSGKMVKGISVSEARTEVVDPPRVAGLGGVVKGEEFASLPKGGSQPLWELVVGGKTKKDDMLRYKMDRIPFLEEKVRKIQEGGKLLTMDIERLLLSEDNRFDFVNEVAAEAKEYVENNRDEYGGNKKAILHVLSNRVNDAGFYRPDAYMESEPYKPGPGYLKEIET
ncbi:hypothetical protein AAG906_004117 [Vitis piasezkii]